MAFTGQMGSDVYAPSRQCHQFLSFPLGFGVSLNRFAGIGMKGHAAGIVIVYDLSPGAALGLVQRSVYTPDGKAGLGAVYVNCPTLTLDRVNGAKVLVDAKAGKTATLTLNARFQRDTGKPLSRICRARIMGPRSTSRSWSLRIPMQCPWLRKMAAWACWGYFLISITFRSPPGRER